ncbi:trypsin-like peptidase domain-containing protein [Streptomyces sp. NPDC102365]|uniref:trypsin-like peptidase domain-containing protein n=1 Tax=Streptomyces sp. NPDC102365 TaxID=3366162 RepID=UPI00380E00A3
MLVTRTGGEYRGSGYLVAPGLVLTARHVIAGASRIRVRFDADRPGESMRAGVPVWTDERVDVAVVSVPSLPGEAVEPAVFGFVGERDAPLKCSVVGFPRFSLRHDSPVPGRPVTSYRDSHHAFGECAPASNRREGTLSVLFGPRETPRSPRPGPPGEPVPHSPWSGMSGAAVWSGDHIIGLISEHRPSDGSGHLTASRVDRWAEQLAPDGLRALEDLLGIPLAPGMLTDVGLPPGPAPADGLRVHVVATAEPRSAPGTAWHGGAEISVGRHSYLLYEGLLGEWSSADHGALLRQARALNLASSGRGARRHVWLRQVVAYRGTESAEVARAALQREHDLLTELGGVPGLPRVTQFLGQGDGRTTTLAVEWPSGPRGDTPCETLADAYGDGPEPLDPWRVGRLFEGLAGLCTALERLHRARVSHRLIQPSTVLLHRDGKLALRDLGLAACVPRRGESGTTVPAPEQSRRGQDLPGPRTDVYQTAALAHLYVTGHLPHAGTPLPLASTRYALPERLRAAVDAALSPSPTSRPPLHALRAGLRAARITR